MKIFPPKFDSCIYGFRTKKSSKNKENWAIAQKKSSNCLIFFAILDFIMVFINNKYIRSNVFYNNHAFFVVNGLIIICIYVQMKLK
ncbi:SdpI family protein [Parvimonas sp. G1641]|uniref:SdpI family protein n=1 Tax=Parvimonas sp. G1641 TaxID=3388846 RepID=UPI003980DE52